MSWWLVAALAITAYSFKVVGLVVLGRRTFIGPAELMAELMPVALLSALVALQTFSDGRSLALDARAVGLAAAGIAVWRRAPFVVVVVVAAGATAATRAIAS